MFAQIAQALRSPTGIDPMGGLDVQRIIAAGQSQSAGKLDDYLQTMQDGLGERVIDAFLIHGRVANRAQRSRHAANAKTTRVLQLNSDFEAYQNDPSASPYYAQWDVAGAAHSSFWIGVHSELGAGPALRGRAAAARDRRRRPPRRQPALHRLRHLELRRAGRSGPAGLHPAGQLSSRCTTP